MVISCYGYGQAMVNPCFSLILWLRFPLGTPGARAAGADESRRRDHPSVAQEGSSSGRTRLPLPRRCLGQDGSSCRRMGVEPGFLKVGTPPKKRIQYISILYRMDDKFGWLLGVYTPMDWTHLHSNPPKEWSKGVSAIDVRCTNMYEPDRRVAVGHDGAWWDMMRMGWMRRGEGRDLHFVLEQGFR